VIENALFITGAQRSGTTLLEKLLDSQDQISLLSQPFPMLFVDAKRAFLRRRGAGDDPFPLGHLFRDERYSPSMFQTYLREWGATRADLEALFARMANYSGQYTRFTATQLDRALEAITDDDDFAVVVAKLDRHLAPSSEKRWYGSKETICEEYIPSLLDRGFRCVIIVRDPRDVAASLNHGRGEMFGGAIKPTLVNVRNWRKSLAFALAMEGHPRFHWCRYEDLVTDPVGSLAGLVQAIDLDGVQIRIPDEIQASAGAVWRGNSSFHNHRGISSASVGAYREVLPKAVAQMIEATCLPELRLLGYETALSPSDAIAVIEGFQEPYAVTRSGVSQDMVSPENAALEVQRLEELAHPTENPARWFLFDPVAARLREGFAG
jgi:hypothetical protein